ncbi:AraC family transcriptional regulator [Actinomadura syzygii]|uniref:AraC family transcriptional regulator n=1 Tax=Actinomadura syzygii TaxID=1427538 RepID=A0A5D0TQL3_9ACTN|nr:AraC family transcriptional regulator [Actinomadura syzygii]
MAEWGHPLHAHEFHQFLHVPVGQVLVTAQGRTHHLNRSVGLWIPAGVPHSARFDREALIVSVTFAADLHRLPFDQLKPINVTNAQRVLLMRAVRIPGGGSDDPDLFAALFPGGRRLLLPLPRSQAAAAVADALLADPQDPRTAAEWAQSSYTSPTSLRRAFRVETGLTFTEWRTRLRLNRSLDLLDEGLLVGAVAARVGFASTNGFILAFRRHFGQTPGSYLRDILVTTA